MSALHTRRILTHGPEGEPLWVRLYVQEIRGTWIFMRVAEEAAPPLPGELKGMSFFAERRLLPQAHSAVDAGRLDRADARRGDCEARTRRVSWFGMRR